MARKSPTLLIGAALVAMGLTIAAGAWVLTREAPGPACRLPDGSLLELRGVSYGSHHRLMEQRLWQKLLAPLLPPGLQGREVAVVGTPANRLVVWFRTRSGPPAWRPGHWIEAVDEHGCCVGRGWEGPTEPGLPDRVGVLEAYPRRAGQFRLQVYQRGAAAPIAQFTVFNPNPGPYPTWKPHPLPMEQRQENLKVRLMALTTERPGDRRWPLRSPMLLPLNEPGSVVDFTAWEGTWAQAWFQIAENGAPSSRWKLAGLVVSDATGNTVPYRTAEAGGTSRSFGVKAGGRSGTVSYSPPEGDLLGAADPSGSLRIAFPGLCLREAAWKLRSTFSYAGPEALHPADLHWTITPALAVPAPGRVHSGVPYMGTGAALRLQAVLGRGAFGTDKPLLRDANVRVFVTSPRDDGLTLALRAMDDRGHEVVCSRGGTLNMGTYHKWWFDLKTRPGAKSMTLTFTGWKGRTFDFVARPVRSTEVSSAALRRLTIPTPTDEITKEGLRRPGRA